MNKAQLFLKKNSSTILTWLGAAGVVATSVLAVKATPKALELIADETNRQNNEILEEAIANNWEPTREYVRKLKPIEVVKTAWKPYIPAIITGAATITCIFGANVLNKRQQASLLSAYALLDNTFKEYRRQTRVLYQEEATNLEHEVIKSKFNPNMKLHEDKELFFDYQAMRYFESTFEEVDHAAFKLNEKLSMNGLACLNDFYDTLGIDHVPYGYQLGWTTFTSDKIYGNTPLDFSYEKTIIDDGSEDGIECYIMTINCPPELEYIC